MSEASAVTIETDVEKIPTGMHPRVADIAFQGFGSVACPVLKLQQDSLKSSISRINPFNPTFADEVNSALLGRSLRRSDGVLSSGRLHQVQGNVDVGADLAVNPLAPRQPRTIDVPVEKA